MSPRASRSWKSPESIGRGHYRTALTGASTVSIGLGAGRAGIMSDTHEVVQAEAEDRPGRPAGSAGPAVAAAVPPCGRRADPCGRRGPGGGGPVGLHDPAPLAAGGERPRELPARAG